VTKLDIQQPLAVIHANDQQSWQQVADALRSAITLSDSAPQTTPMVYQRITA